MSVVDVGCGTGSVSFAISRMVGEQGSVDGIDSNPFAIDYCKDTAHKLCATYAKFI